MKKIFFSLFSALFIAVVFCGCDKTSEAELELTSSSEVVLDDGATPQATVISFTTNRYWLAKASESWAHVDPYSGTDEKQFASVTVTFDANPTNEPRQVVVTIYAGGLTQSVTITQPGAFYDVTAISISHQEVVMSVGETLQMTAKVSPKNATEPVVTWSVSPVSTTSGDNLPVTVSSTGLVEAVGIGYAYVVATCGEYTAECQVTVVSADAATLYVYSDMDWEKVLMYAWDAYSGTDYTTYPGVEADAMEEIQGRQFYKFIVNSKWISDYTRFLFNDGQSLRSVACATKWAAGNSYYIYLPGQYESSNYAKVEFIDDIATFDPDNYPSGSGAPANAIYFEDFENVSSWAPAWTMIDSDSDGNGWMSARSLFGSGEGHNGSADMLLSQSFNNEAGALTPDNWAFTPAIALPDGQCHLSFYMCPQDTSYPKEHYAVYVTESIRTSGDIAAGCTLLMEGTMYYQTNKWIHFNVPVPDEFKGKTVYFGFRHFNCTNYYCLNLDDVAVVAD